MMKGPLGQKIVTKENTQTKSHWRPNCGKTKLSISLDFGESQLTIGPWAEDV